MIRKILAWFIKPGKKPTNENVLKHALKNYLNKTVVTGKYHGFGLCIYLATSLEHYYNIQVPTCEDIDLYFPLFDKHFAVLYFKGRDGAYWWDIKDWWHRYRFMKWLIKQYKE